MTIEKREHERVKLDRRIAIIQSDGSAVYAQAKDISMTGIAVICQYYCDIGQQFEIAFHISGSPNTTQFRAKVITRFMNFVGCNKYQIGMKFQEFKGDSEEMLKKYIKKRRLQPKYSSDLSFTK
ncbi:MAG: PilZ domain-containing protein [Gammaproteobacteria bacterium]|nr:MAG: PilZ domain-containing protein [Gammaproteobacteria bacterium]